MINEAFASLVNGFTNERARRLCSTCLTEYVGRAYLDPPDDMEGEISILITLVKQFADKPPLAAIAHIQKMPTIGGSTVGKIFIEALRDGLPSSPNKDRRTTPEATPITSVERKLAESRSLLGSSNAEVRKQAMSDLHLLGSPSAEVRKQTISDASAHLGSEAMEHILPLLDDPDEFVRVYAVRALGDIADGSAIAAIQDAKTCATSDIAFYYDDAIAAISARNTSPQPTQPQAKPDAAHDQASQVAPVAPADADDERRTQAKPSAPETLVLVCACGQIYRIGEDSVAVSMEFGMKLAAGAIVLSTGVGVLEREDLVARVTDEPPGSMRAALDRAQASLELIRMSLARGESRMWCCKECGSVNSYSQGKISDLPPAKSSAAAPPKPAEPERSALGEKLILAIKGINAEDVRRLLAAGARAEFRALKEAEPALRGAITAREQLVKEQMIPPKSDPMYYSVLSFCTGGERSVISRGDAAEEILMLLRSLLK